MLYGPTFDLIYRHTLALISALFNADLSTRSNLFVLFYISSFLLLEQAICHSCYPYGNKIFPDFQLQIQVQEDLWSSWFINLDTYRDNLYFTFIFPFLPFLNRFTVSLRYFSFILIKWSVRSRRGFTPFAHDGTKKKKFCLQNEKILSVYIARQNLARVHSMKTSAEDR